MSYETLTEVVREQRLHPGQDYVFDLADALGIETKIVKHDKATKTCYEKAEILGWSPDRVVKAVYFHDGSYGGLVGIITPELGRKIDTGKLIPQALPGVSKQKAASYTVDRHYLPEGMACGTCSPFPLESNMIDEISKIIIYDHPEIDDQFVDISVGGSDEESFKTSMHIRYKDIYTILSSKFGDKVVKVS
jgi:prolyl-tRNA editing enzyme YbaK/EbsC (Cys-tRNA(Pro) deacylase)